MINRCNRFFLLALVAIALPCAAAAKPPRGAGLGGGGFGRPAFLEQLFRPEQVMRHQEAIALSAEQRAAISRIIRETQERLLALQWQLEARSEEAGKLFAAERIDIEPAMARAAAVMAVESEIKTEHLRLLIRVKNELTPAQQEKLRQLRPKRRGAAGGPGGD